MKFPTALGLSLSLMVASLAALVPLSTAAGDPSADSAVIVIRDTTVIDGTGADPRTGVDVLIRGDRVAAVGADLDVDESTRILDGSGKFVVPGLIDTNVHLQFPIVFQLTPEEREVVPHTQSLPVQRRDDGA